MPALTHNRVKNGFNGGIRKKNASTGTVKSRTMGMGGTDGLRRNALIGGIGSMPAHIRRAYNRRVRCSCALEETTYPIFLNEPDAYAEAGSNYNFTVRYTHATLGRRTNYEILAKPDWITISTGAKNTIVITGLPQLSNISTDNILTIKLVDDKGKDLQRSYNIKVYFKVYNVEVNSAGISPILNYYILKDYDGNQINLGETMIYDTANTALYRFNQYHSSNINHPLRLSNKNGTTNTLTSDLTIVGTAGNNGAYVEFASKNAENYIYCLYHGFGMGGFYQPSSSLFNVFVGSDKFNINNNTSLAIKLNYRGAYLFNLNDTSNETYNMVFKTTDDINGDDYNKYYSYGTPGTNGFVVLVINDNLNITIQEKNNAGYGVDYNTNISIESTNQAGSITMAGTFKQEEVITANISDPDGYTESNVTYQWYRDDVAISGANSKTYTIVADDYNKQLHVNAIYVDVAGFNENVTSTKETVQDTPGTITLVGNYIVNNSILAQLDDVDGNGVNVISSYQWVIHDSGTAVSTAVNIANATSVSYIPVIADIGKLINIKISYTDNNGTSYTDVVCENSVEITKEANEPGNLEITGLLQDGSELTAVVSDQNLINKDQSVVFTWFRVDSSNTSSQIVQNTITQAETSNTISNNYTLTTDDIDNSIKVTATYTDRGGNDESLEIITVAIQEADTTAPVISAVTQVSTPNINTTPSFVFNSNEAGLITSNYNFTTTTTAVVGNNTITFDILGVGTYNDVWVKVTDLANNVSNELTLNSFEIVSPSSNGSVSITGVTQLNKQLTATVTDSNVADFNTTTVTYQWIRNDNDSLTNIGTNSANYTLVQDDVGKVIRVNVTYVDDLGNNEDVTSADTATILDAGPVITEVTQITSSINPTPVYKFNSNKAGTITSNYKFLSTSNAVVGDNKIRFSSLKEGAHNDIWIKVTDSAGAESNELAVNNFSVNALDLVNDAGLSNTNDGIAYVDAGANNYAEGVELTCSLVDNDGGSGFTFVWYRISGERPNETSVVIAGATGQTYTLTNEDVGKRIQVQASYTDGASNSETMKTWYTPVISDKKTLSVDSSSGSYRINTYGDDNHPTLTFERGQTYEITLSTSGHPFRIQTNDLAANNSDAELYNSGLSHDGGDTGSAAQDKESGVLTFTVPFDAPETLYYRCQVHSGMVGTINIVSNQLRFYYNDASLKDIVDKSSEILEDLFTRYKKDYDIIVRIKDASEFSSVNTIATASYQSQTLNINTNNYDSSADGTLNDQPVKSFVTTFVHEVFHVFELVANKNSGLYDASTFFYTGTNGLEGYKNLITVNNNNSVFTGSLAKTLDISNMVGVPIEDDFGTGTKFYHWEEGLHQEDDGSTTDEPRSYDNGAGAKDYPILTNEIMTGLKAGNDKYLTPMTTGALKDVGHSINDVSKWVATTGTNMSWK